MSTEWKRGIRFTQIVLHPETDMIHALGEDGRVYAYLEDPNEPNGPYWSQLTDQYLED